MREQSNLGDAYSTDRSGPADVSFLFVCSHLAILKSGHVWSKIKLNTLRGTREGNGSYKKNCQQDIWKSCSEVYNL